MQEKETDSNIIPIISKNLFSIECVLAVTAHSDQNHGASPPVCVREREREKRESSVCVCFELVHVCIACVFVFGFCLCVYMLI